MPEIKRKVMPVEVNYVCDKCGYGMMQQTGPTNKETGENPHECMICGHNMTFKGVTYPHISYMAEDDNVKSVQARHVGV